MSSPLVHRYAEVCQKPLSEVEVIWRKSKVEANRNGKKNDWNWIVEAFRKELGLEKEEARLVYFDGAEAEIVSESPSFALIRVHDIGDAPEYLRKLLETTEGLIVVNFEHLTKDEEGKNPVGYPYQRKKEETTASVGVASSAPGSSAPAPSVSYEGEDYDLTGIKNKTATLFHKKTKKRKKVKLSELFGFPEKPSSLDSIKGIWDSINPSLTENQKKKAVELILESEGFPYIPEPLIEISKDFDLKKPNTGAPAKPPAIKSGEEENREKGGTEGFTVDDEDWEFVFSPSDEDIEGSERAMPSLPPVEPGEEVKEPVTKAGPPDEDSDDEEGEEDDNAGIRKPDAKELQKMLGKIRAPKSSFNLRKAADSAERAASRSESITLVENKPLAIQDEETRKAVRKKQFETWDSLLGAD